MGKFVARIATLALFVGAGLFPMATAGASSVCNTSTPSGTVTVTYTVTLCIDAPVDGSTVTGDVPVTVSYTVNGTGPTAQRMQFNLDGQYLLTDYQTPYTFLLPTEKFADGAHTLSVQAWMRDQNLSDFTNISLNFSNGNATQPQNNGALTPTPGTNPAAGQPFVLAAVGDGAGGDQSAADVTNLISSWNPNLFFYLGDVYEKGSRSEFFNWYQSSRFFGRFASITDPTVGNHEYTAGVADGYFDYWGQTPRTTTASTRTAGTSSAWTPTAPSTSWRRGRPSTSGCRMISRRATTRARWSSGTSRCSTSVRSPRRSPSATSGRCWRNITCRWC